VSPTKRRQILFPTAAIALLLLATGCGTVGEFLLGSLRKVVVQTARTATSQAVEQTAVMIEGVVEQAAEQVIQSATSQAASVIDDGLQQLLDRNGSDPGSP